MGNVHPFGKLLLLLSLFLSSFCFAQVQEQWIKRYNGLGNGPDVATDLALDIHSNVYITGYNEGIETKSDYVTIKYDAAGNELWAKRYNGLGNGNDMAYSLAVDASGNVYVTGQSEGNGTSSDYATIKYDTNGNELWVKKYNFGNRNDVATDLVVDAAGNVYVTGWSDLPCFPFCRYPLFNYATIKYDTNGNELWVRRYDSSEDTPFDDDKAYALAVDASGNVYVTGRGLGSGTGYDYATIKYDASGNEQWVRKYDGSGNFPIDIDEATSLAVDATGNVYVTGYSFNSGASYDYTTIKYDAAGNVLWVRIYGTQESDQATSLAVDASGNVYVTGRSPGSGTNNDYATIKYDVAGNELWVKRYNGPGNSDDEATSLAIDTQGNVYVTGQSVGNNSLLDYATIKYDVNGNELWVQRYNGPGSQEDVARSVAVDAQGNVYVTGSSYGSNGSTDFATIRYTQTVVPPVQVNAGADQTLYLGYDPKCVTLTAQATEGTPPYGYNWSPGGGTSASVKVCPSTTTTYTVTVRDAGGQTASDEVVVNVNDVRCGNKGDKVLVCHKGKTLCISANAVEAHLKHGDQLGSCSGSSDLNSITENKDASQMMEQMGKQFRIIIAPNPVSTITRLQYELPEEGEVSIKVYDVVGREIATVVKLVQKASVYTVNFNTADLSKGVYYYRALLTTKQKTYTLTGKLIVVK